MHKRRIYWTLLALAATAATATAWAARPNEKRERADYILVGPVLAVYLNDSKGYRSYIVEIRVDEVVKGEGVKKRDIFRADCYQRKPGFGGLEFDTAGHTVVPEQGQRVEIFVKEGRGHHEGTYPNWVDVLDDAEK